jgi:hypothetical protein
MEKQTLKKRIDEIENLFRKGELYHGLGEMKDDFKVRKRMGLLELAGKPNALALMTEVCEEYVRRHGDDLGLVLRMVGCGLPVRTIDKVRLAEYHTALQIILMGCK